MMKFDRRRPPWLPGKSRMEGFDALARLAQQGMSQSQMARALGTTMNAVNAYMWRWGITMAELRGEDVDG